MMTQLLGSRCDAMRHVFFFSSRVKRVCIRFLGLKKCCYQVHPAFPQDEEAQFFEDDLIFTTANFYPKLQDDFILVGEMDYAWEEVGLCDLWWVVFLVQKIVDSKVLRSKFKPPKKTQFFFFNFCHWVGRPGCLYGAWGRYSTQQMLGRLDPFLKKINHDEISFGGIQLQ